MSEVFRFERRVEFCETDAAGIAHFSAFVVYMEQSEHALFRFLGETVFPRPVVFQPSADRDSQSPSSSPEHFCHVTWPRVHVELDFLAPAHFEDLLTIAVCVTRLGSKSVTYAFEFSNGTSLLATGKMTSVCCISSPGSEPKKLEGTTIPESIRSKLSRFVANAPASGL